VWAAEPASPLAQTTLFPRELPALEFSGQVTTIPAADAYLGRLIYVRLASPEELAPSSAGTGRLETVILAAGTRSTDLSTFDFRWRLALIDTDLIRSPLSLGLTLFDFNRIDWLDADYRWVNLRLGPSLFLGTPLSFFSVRAIGSAGLTSAKLGGFLYDGLGPEIRVLRRGYELGYAGEVHALIRNRVSVQAILAYRTLLGGGRPQLYRATGSIGGRIGATLAIHATFTAEEARIGRSRRQQEGYGLTFRYGF
jgi:hypothetical protein